MLVQKNEIETRSNFTQTCKFLNEENEENVYAGKAYNVSPSTPFVLFHDKNEKYRHVEEPAPQWLIEAALSRGNGIYKEYVNVCTHETYFAKYFYFILRIKYFALVENTFKLKLIKTLRFTQK